MNELVLPWPDRRLHPNARVHWRAKAPVTKAARTQAHLLTLEAGWHREKLPDGKLHLWLDFYPPNRLRRDDDGLLSAMKAARDGIADALKVDDHRFVSHPRLMEEVRTDGQVVVRITGGPDA
jgi:crossover junction endodeoxyribonuclease RusA